MSFGYDECTEWNHNFQWLYSCGGGAVSVDITYVNDVTTFPATFVDVFIDLDTNPSGVSVTSAGPWVATYIPAGNTVNFNGLTGGSWDPAPGASNPLGTIIITPVPSGCVSLSSDPASIILAGGTGVVPPVADSDTYCTFSGEVNLAAGNNVLRTRLVDITNNGMPDPPGGLTSGNNYAISGRSSSNPNFEVEVFQAPFAKFNGNVDILDVVAIQANILGTTPFTLPFQQVASDINRDDFIDVLDLVGIQRGLLGISEADMVTPWAYPTDPALSAVVPGGTTVSYTEQYNQSDIETLSSLDFTAVKLGDPNVVGVDYDKSATPGVLLALPDQALLAGETIQIPVRASSSLFPSLLSLSLGVDNALSLLGVQGGALSVGNEDFKVSENGTGLKMIWFSLDEEPDELNAQDILFYLEVRANENVANLSQHLSLVNDQVGNHLAGVANTKQKGNNLQSIEFLWAADETPAVASLAVSLLSANPVQHELMLSIHAPSSQNGQLAVFDLHGKLLAEQSVILEAGKNFADLSSITSLMTPGSYFVRLTTGDTQKTLRVIKQ